jgi:excinuclease ABC subunit C
VGTKTIELLLTTYKSVEKIKSLQISELIKIIGQKKAIIVFEHFNNEVSH